MTHQRRCANTKIVVLTTCLLTLLATHEVSAAPATAGGRTDCHTLAVTRTFLQLWQRDAERSPEYWHQMFSSLRRLGFEEVIIQWSSYGDLSLYADPRDGRLAEPFLATVIEAIRAQRLRAWLGLHYDPDFWPKIERPTRLMATYLNRRLADLEQRIDLLMASVERADPDQQTIVGWYIAEEIDDVNWQSEERAAVLVRYLSHVRELLKNKNSAWPVMISGFSNGKLPPHRMANTLREMLTESGIEIFLFQDGIGAGKLSWDELEFYLSALATEFKMFRGSLGIVTELFRLDDAHTEFKDAAAADFRQVARQLELGRSVGNEPLTVFSAPDYLLARKNQQAWQLRLDWQRDRSACLSDYARAGPSRS